ncbi:MAG: metallophosphoesterase [Spirochaetia bacterium]
MRILCVADHIDPLVYTTAIRKRFADADLVLSAGDLPMEYLGFISASLNKRIFFVFGNHHLKHLPLFRRSTDAMPQGGATYAPEPMFRNYFGSTCIEGKAIRHKKLLIAGLGGCRRYNSGSNQFTEFQMRGRIVRIVPRLVWNRVVHGRFLDILLTHASPFGLNDRPDRTHVGFRAFVRFMDWFRPKYLLHGHIHLYDLNASRMVKYKETEIINIYDHYVLDFSPE